MTNEIVKMTVGELTNAVALEVMGWHEWAGGGGVLMWCSKSGRILFPIKPRFKHDNGHWNPAKNANHRDLIMDKFIGQMIIYKRKDETYNIGICRNTDPYKRQSFSAAHACLGVAVMAATYEMETGKPVEVVE